MFHILYLKSQFGKYFVNQGDTDTRDKDDLHDISAKTDRRTQLLFLVKSITF